MSIGTYLNFILSLVFVLGLIGVAAWAYRRLAGTNPLARRLGASNRLAVIEMRPIDARRKLVLVRRDGTEHLLLLGPTGETVVESGITPPPAENRDAAP